MYWQKKSKFTLLSCLVGLFLSAVFHASQVQSTTEIARPISETKRLLTGVKESNRHDLEHAKRSAKSEPDDPGIEQAVAVVLESTGDSRRDQGDL